VVEQLNLSKSERAVVIAWALGEKRSAAEFEKSLFRDRQKKKDQSGILKNGFAKKETREGLAVTRNGGSKDSPGRIL